jgi:hypothetical protein
MSSSDAPYQGRDKNSSIANAPHPQADHASRSRRYNTIHRALRERVSASLIPWHRR